METIKDAWEIYKARLLSQNVSNRGIALLKHSFYAGACGYQNVLTHIDDNCNEKQGVRILNDVNGELTEFIKSLSKDDLQP